MPRLIAFAFCIAFLVGAGVSVTAGMFVASAAVLALVGFAGWCWVQMLIGTAR